MSFQGVAPDADLVSVQAFDEEGNSSYLDVIEGLDWVLTNKEKYNIKVLNLSFSAPPASFYEDTCLD